LQENLFPNTTVNIANPENYSVPFIINTIETHLDKKAISFEEDKGDNYDIDISQIKPLISYLNIPFNDDYLTSLLKRYYHSR
jgi:hypothetical protein